MKRSGKGSKTLLLPNAAQQSEHGKDDFLSNRASHIFHYYVTGLGNRSFALFNKSNKEQFALSLFSKRAKKSNLLFRSLQKEQQRANRSFALLKRSPKSKSLFRSFKKSAKERIALFKESKRAQNEQIAL